jgi:hypothetical protein
MSSESVNVCSSGMLCLWYLCNIIFIGRVVLGCFGALSLYLWSAGLAGLILIHPGSSGRL